MGWTASKASRIHVKMFEKCTKKHENVNFYAKVNVAYLKNTPLVAQLVQEFTDTCLFLSI